MTYQNGSSFFRSEAKDWVIEQGRQNDTVMQMTIAESYRELEETHKRFETSFRDEIEKCTAAVTLATSTLEEEQRRRSEVENHLHHLDKDLREQLKCAETRATTHERATETQKISMEQGLMGTQDAIAAAMEKQTRQLLEKCSQLVHDAKEDTLTVTLNGIERNVHRIQDDLPKLWKLVEKERDERSKTCEQLQSLCDMLQEEVQALARETDLQGVQEALEGRLFSLRREFEGQVEAVMKNVSEEVGDCSGDVYAQQRLLLESIEREGNLRREEISKIEDAVCQRMDLLEAFSNRQGPKMEAALVSSEELQSGMQQIRRHVAEAFRLLDSLKSEFEEFKDEQKIMWGFLEADVKARHNDVLRELQSLNGQLMA